MLQVLAKSCKPIPILIFGVLFAAKKYHWKKYVFVLMIVVGVAIFLYKDKAGASRGRSMFSFGMGEFFLVNSFLSFVSKCLFVRCLNYELIQQLLDAFIWRSPRVVYGYSRFQSRSEAIFRYPMLIHCFSCLLIPSVYLLFTSTSGCRLMASCLSQVNKLT